MPALDPSYKLLLPFDSDFADVSPSAHPVTVVGAPQISTVSPFAGSGAALFNGSTQYLKLDGSSDFIFGTGDFTLDFFFKALTVSGVQSFYVTSGGSEFQMYLLNNSLRLWAVGNDRIVGATAIVANTWYRASCIKQSGNTRLYLNKIQEGSTYVDANNYTLSANEPVIGTHSNLSMQFYGGRLDEYRVLKGLADTSFPDPPFFVPTPLALTMFN
jgi:Concanavalin A-like lectin/glucanases superfamily